MKSWRIGVLFFVFFCFTARKVHAVTVTISDFAPTNLIDDEARNILVNVSVASSSASTSAYLRGMFFTPQTSTSYFGCTKGTSVSEFACGTTATDFPLIQGSGSFTITVKANTSSSFYAPNTQVWFKVRRCLSSGCSGGDNDSNVVTLQLVTTTPSPAPTNSATPLPTSTPTPTPKPTSTPIFSPTPIPTLDPKAEGADVLGLSTQGDGTPSPQVSGDSPSPSPILSAFENTVAQSPPGYAIVAIVLGTLSLIGVGFYLWYDWKKKKI